MNARRALTAARALWGATLLATVAQPGRHTGTRPLVRTAAGLLGVRHLAEALVMVGDPRPPRWSIAVDALHATSMAWVAARSRALRRPALISCAAAGTLAAVSVYERGSLPDQRPQ